VRIPTDRVFPFMGTITLLWRCELFWQSRMFFTIRNKILRHFGSEICRYINDYLSVSSSAISAIADGILIEKFV
jgi:hypothetical protein